jgi:hypothetical protein
MKHTIVRFRGGYRNGTVAEYLPGETMPQLMLMVMGQTDGGAIGRYFCGSAEGSRADLPEQPDQSVTWETLDRKSMRSQRYQVTDRQETGDLVQVTLEFVPDKV